VGSEWLIVKMVVKKGCSDRLDAKIGWIDHVSHDKESLLSAIELGLVYTMDQEVVLGRCKSVHWLLISSQDHFGLHQGKNGKVTMKVEVPTRYI
jgi:hypothetical protein